MLAEIINIVGITAYALLAVFFTWVRNVSSPFMRSHYWLVAVMLILAARLNLYFLPGYIAPENIQVIYAYLVTLEKFFIILGLLYFIDKKAPKPFIKALSGITIIVLTGIFFSHTLLENMTVFRIWFSVTQAGYLLSVAVIFWRNRQTKYLKNRYILITLIVVYACHWVTFPIAINYPTWLSFGYLFGNMLNLILYLSFAYLVVYRFQYRMLNAEQSALALAKEAKQANKAKSEFLANMSHEIRTPMNGILGILELLHMDELNNEQKEKISIALNSSKNLLNIINDILDFSKIEAGKLQFDHIEFNVVTLLEEVTAVMQSLADSKSLTLTLDTANIHIPMVKGDPLRIKQVLLNLVGNAIKFTEVGQISVRGTIKTIDEGTHFICTVEDTGIGIDESQLNNIFSSFSQGDSSTTRTYGGTGLGLSISKRLCRLMDGDITATSSVGNGSIFTITIPVDAINIAAKEDEDIEQMAASWDGSEKLLLVEDNRINQIVACKMLAMFNLSCDIANNGTDAIAKLKVANEINRPYSLILMDCQMPVMDGYEATKEIRDGRAGASHTKVTIIAMTANAMSGDRAKCIDAGMDDYFTKPLEKNVMLNVLKKWLVSTN